MSAWVDDAPSPKVQNAATELPHESVASEEKLAVSGVASGAAEAVHATAQPVVRV